MAAFFWIFITIIKNINTIQHILSISKQLIIKNNNLELRNFQKLLDFFSIFYYNISIFKNLKLWKREKEMPITFAFITIILIFIRIYCLFSLTFLESKKVKFSERVTIFILIFEVIVILLHLFFNTFRYLLPPMLVLLKTAKYFVIFKNVSIVGSIYAVVNLFLLITFNGSDVLKFINRSILFIVFMINILFGFLILLG